MNVSIKEVYNSSPELLARRCTVASDGRPRFVFRPFQKFISEKIVSAIEKGSGRFTLSVPPQHGKSEVASHWIPVWFLSNYPHKHIILLSYNETIAAKWGRVVRNTIKANEDILKVKLSQDSTAAAWWHTSEGGSMLCSGVGGTITGNPGHVIIIDDPFKNWADAMNKNNRDKIIEWYLNTVTQRFQEDTTVVIIQTRWHENDLAGYLLKHGVEKWEELRIPAIAEENDLIGRKVGEPLLKSKGVKFLETRKKEMGSMAFAAVYQQRPQAQEGNIFLRDYWQRFTPDAKVKKFTRIVCSWDTAFETKKTAAYTACTIWGELSNSEFGIRNSELRGNRYYLLDMWRKKADYPSVKSKIIEIQKKYDGAICLLEDKASGKSLRQELVPLGVPVIAVTPVADKMTRAYACTPLFEDKRVFLEAGVTWADEIVDGCASYPAGDYADVVDTISQALVWMSNYRVFRESELQDLLQDFDCERTGDMWKIRTPNLIMRDIFKFGRV